MFSFKILNSESSPEITNLRESTHYVFTRALAKVIYYVFVILSILAILLSPVNYFVYDDYDFGFGFIAVISGWFLSGILFLAAKLTYESFSVILDIGDASVANLSKTNTNKTSIDSSAFSNVVDELKKISEQNKAQSEALTKSIDEFSDKTEKTNAYLYHILSNMK